MEFLGSFLRRHLVGKPVEALPNVRCFFQDKQGATERTLRRSGCGLFNCKCGGIVKNEIRKE